MAETQQKVIISHLKTSNAEALQRVSEMLSQKALAPATGTEEKSEYAGNALLLRVSAVQNTCTSYLVEVRHQVDSSAVDFPDVAQPLLARTWAFIDIEKSIIASTYHSLSLSSLQIWETLCRESGAPDTSPLSFPAIVRADVVFSAAEQAKSTLQASCPVELRFPKNKNELDKYALNPTTIRDLWNMKSTPLSLMVDFLPKKQITFGQKIRTKWASLFSKGEKNDFRKMEVSSSPEEACRAIMDAIVVRTITCDRNKPEQVAEAVKAIIEQESL